MSHDRTIESRNGQFASTQWSVVLRAGRKSSPGSAEALESLCRSYWSGEVPLGRFDLPSEKASIDNRLDEVVMRALERDLPKRYQQVSELTSEVESISRNNMSPPQAPRTFAAEPVSTQTDMSSHITILGIASLAMSSIFVIAGIGIFVLLGTIGVASQDPEAMKALPTIGGGLGTVLLLLGLPGTLAGYGLLNRKPWSRYLMMILAFFNLINIPFGTALAIYAFWVLLHENTVALFAESERVSSSPRY